jgi:hypothetical protein
LCEANIIRATPAKASKLRPPKVICRLNCKKKRSKIGTQLQQEYLFRPLFSRGPRLSVYPVFVLPALLPAPRRGERRRRRRAGLPWRPRTARPADAISRGWPLPPPVLPCWSFLLPRGPHLDSPGAGAQDVEEEAEVSTSAMRKMRRRSSSPRSSPSSAVTKHRRSSRSRSATRTRALRGHPGAAWLASRPGATRARRAPGGNCRAHRRGGASCQTAGPTRHTVTRGRRRSRARRRPSSRRQPSSWPM